MGALNSFYRAHHTASSDFEILVISIDEDTAQAAHFATEKKLTFPVLLDPHETVARAYEQNGVPTLFVIDQHGDISYAHVGFDRRDAFERVLAGELGINVDQPLKGGSSGASD